MAGFRIKTGLAQAGLELQPRGEELHKWPRRPRSGTRGAGPGQSPDRVLQAPRPRCGREYAGPPAPDPQTPRGPPRRGRMGSGEADRTPDAGTDAARQAAEQGRGAHPCAAGGAGGKPGTRALNFPRTRCQGGCFLFNIFCACFSSCPPSHSFPTPTRQAEKQEAVKGWREAARGGALITHPPAPTRPQRCAGSDCRAFPNVEQGLSLTS